MSDTPLGKTALDYAREHIHEVPLGALPPFSEDSPGTETPPGVPEAVSVPLRDLSVLNLQLGDVLVLRYRHTLSPSGVEWILSWMEDTVLGHRVVVLDPSTELSVLRPPSLVEVSVPGYDADMDPANWDTECPDCPHAPKTHRPTTGCIRCPCNFGRTAAAY